MNRKTLVLGTVLGAVVAVVANGFSLATIEYPCTNCTVSYGIPFRIAEMGGFYGSQKILWGGVAGDLAVFIVIGILLAGVVDVFSRPRRKFRPAGTDPDSVSED